MADYGTGGSEADEAGRADKAFACECDDPNAPASLFSGVSHGVDETAGRFADVTLSRCRSCSRLWVRYVVEYEAFSQSGRWARGLVSEDQALSITPETTVDLLNALDSYLYGGSYFGGKAGRRRGWMPW